MCNRTLKWPLNGYMRLLLGANSHIFLCSLCEYDRASVIAKLIQSKE
uniref:Uncharacterized protein n=1 Tax=Anguilla anguilla TaxID=7936 RepID=A0A0E9SX59_ANGAN